jgi:hypothetical protein
MAVRGDTRVYQQLTTLGVINHVHLGLVRRVDLDGSVIDSIYVVSEDTIYLVSGVLSREGNKDGRCLVYLSTIKDAIARQDDLHQEVTSRLLTMMCIAAVVLSIPDSGNTYSKVFLASCHV